MTLKLNSTAGGSVSLDAPSGLASANTITLPSTSGGTFLTTPLAAGTTTVPPLDFTAGTNMTTPDTGAMEYDGIKLCLLQLEHSAVLCRGCSIMS